MADDDKPVGSAWTKPPKRPRGRPRKTTAPVDENGYTKTTHPAAKAKKQAKGARDTVQRRATMEATRAELAAGEHKEPPFMPPLMDAMDLVLEEGPFIPELVGDEKKRGPGATAFREEYIRIARTLCELGATDIEVARALGVSLSTMWGWQSRYEEFFRAMIVGKDLPDERVIRALYQRAVGYSYPEIQIKTINGGLHVVPVVKHIPPDVQACNSWLRSRRRDEWSETKTLNLTSSESFQSLWQAISTGQILPMIDVTPEDVTENVG